MKVRLYHYNEKEKKERNTTENNSFSNVPGHQRKSIYSSDFLTEVLTTPLTSLH